ncbi:hypothetical protein BHM03_00000354 [Ensete ventricosum]|uniref:Uncharacterized protein n=1 Tax=Ensete ventricosum TaxID=4639 RepID=A0A445M8D5_ENSVE|nr:hypothetical protein BHM03_00000354 [Ensete ventricosum]
MGTGPAVGPPDVRVAERRRTPAARTSPDRDFSKSTGACRMSSTSSHFESCSVEVSARRSRALGRPSGDSKSTVIPSSFKGTTLDDYGATEALTTMQSCFNLDSTVTARWLIDVRKHYYVPPKYELHVSLLGQHPYDVFSNGFDQSIDALEAGLSGSTTSASSTLGFVVITAEKRPDTNEGVNLRKRNKGVAPEQLVGVVGSTTKAPAKKGKELVEIEELPERGYSNRNLCEVEDRAGVNRILALRAANKELKLATGQEVVATVEHQVKELQATMDWL